MAAPSNQEVLQWVVPPGQAQVQYTPQALAWRVRNFEVTPDATLRSVRSPAPYQINVSSKSAGGYDFRLGEPELIEGIPSSIFHAKLFGGVSDMLLVACTDGVRMHKGWSDHRGSSSNRSIKFNLVIKDLHEPKSPHPLSHSTRYPAQFLVMNDLVIFTNGIDQARIIRPDGEAFLLGFSDPASTPMAEGPTGLDIEARDSFYPNSHGFSWEGNIGTAGDMLSADGGGVLAGHWRYYMQYEDQFGNLSGTSPESNAVYIEPHVASPLRGAVGGLDGVLAKIEKTLGVEIKDVMRQFSVRCNLPKGDHNVVAVRLYRTPDIDNVGATPRLLDRIPIGHDFAYSDNMPDAELGDDMVHTSPVPVFKVMCQHQGRLVIGNIAGSPGMVRRSEVESPGTFPTIDFVYPDSGGAEITALVSHKGSLLAFTPTSVYSIDDFSAPIPLSQGVGCIAPSSVKATRDGRLIWLGRDGFYSLGPEGIELISAPIDRIMKKRLNVSRLRLASATIDPDSGEYRCAVTPAGSSAQTRILCFDGTFWREVDYGMHVAGWARTNDSRDLSLFYGVDADVVNSGKLPRTIPEPGKSRSTELIDTWYRRGPSVYVTNRETSSATESCMMSHRAKYRSAWLRGDQNALTPINVRTMYLGLIDTEDSELTIQFYKNGSGQAVSTMTVKTAGLDDATGVVTGAGQSAILGEARAHLPRLFWRQVPVNLNNVHTWAFSIQSVVDATGGTVELAAFAFDVATATGGNVRARIPQRSDE